MQNAGLQYGEGVTPVQESPFVSAPVQINPSNSTSSLRQFRKKDNVDKAAVVSGALSAANPSGQDSTNSSHVARVAPHNHYPHKQNEYFRYPPQYQDYSSPPVKYSEIAEPTIQPIPHLDHLPPSVLTKHKEKEYVEMCNIPQQGHLNKPYPEHQFNGQQGYPPEMSMHHQYMHKEPQGAQIHSPYKAESQYIPKEGAFNHQIPPYLKYNIPQSRNYGPLDNSSLTPFQRMDPHLARSFMAEHHHIREFPTEYSPMEQTRMYAQKQRYYPTPLPPSNTTYPPNYPHRNIPAQQYNYPSCNYPRSAQMNSSMGRYAMNMERSISPRRTYSENMDMSMNFSPVPQKIPANYPNYPAYAQHYQQRRPTVPQEYYHHQQHSHPRQHPQYMPNHHPQEMTENHVASNNIRQYLENWAEEEPTNDLPTPIENSKYISRINPREEPNEVYVINASELPQYLENGVPLIASENGQYIFKSNVSIDNTGAIKIIDKSADNAALPTDAQERVVSLHIIENPKTDCLINNRQSSVNQENQVAAIHVPMDVMSGNSNQQVNMENPVQRSFNQAGYNTNRMNVHQVSPMTQSNSETSINLSTQSTSSNVPQQINRSSSGSPQKIHGNVDNDQLKIQVLSYNEVPQNSCIVMPSTQNRLNFDESLLPNPVPCDLKQKKSSFELKNTNDTNSVIANVMNEEAILKEAHEELDKIVQDTLTSTNIQMPLESCDRTQIPKIEEKCTVDSINSRIPDYLNLDLETNPKDSNATLSECPISNLEVPVENEAIIDLSTTSRRSSKTENDSNELLSSVADLSAEPTKDKYEEEIDKKQTETGVHKEITDKGPIKHMPLIFDGFDESLDKNNSKTEATDSKTEASNTKTDETDCKSEATKPNIEPTETKTETTDTKTETTDTKTETTDTKTITIDSKTQNENQENRVIPLVEENKQEEEDIETKLKKESELSVSDPMKQITIASLVEKNDPTESNRDKEPSIPEDNSEKVMKETPEEINSEIKIAEKVESSGKNEPKEDLSEVIVEEKAVESMTTKENEEVKDNEENKSEKDQNTSDQIKATESFKSGIKRKRIFSVDDIIYRIGSTSIIQNPFSDTLDGKIEKNSIENCVNAVVEEIGENKKTSNDDETDHIAADRDKEDLSPQDPKEELSVCKQKTEEMEESVNMIKKQEETTKKNDELKESDQTTKFEESDSISEKDMLEIPIDDSNPIQDIANNACLSSNEDKSVENEDSKDTGEKIVHLDNDMEITPENTRCEEMKKEENFRKQTEDQDMEFCADDRNDKSETTLPDTDTVDALSVEETEEKKNTRNETQTHELATCVVRDPFLPEDKDEVMEDRKDNTLEKKKIKILSNEILVHEKKEASSEEAGCLSSSEIHHGIKTENLKRNLCEVTSIECTGGNETGTSNKKLKLDDCKSSDNFFNQETGQKKASTELEPDGSSTSPCRFSVIQRTETIHKVVTNVESFQEKLPCTAGPDVATSSSPIEDKEMSPKPNRLTEDKEEAKKDKVEVREIEHTTPTSIEEDFSAITEQPEENTSTTLAVETSEKVEETAKNPQVTTLSLPLTPIEIGENVKAPLADTTFSCEPIQKNIIDDIQVSQTEDIPKTTDKVPTEHIHPHEERVHAVPMPNSKEIFHTGCLTTSIEPIQIDASHTGISPTEKNQSETILKLEESVHTEHIANSEKSACTEHIANSEKSACTELIAGLEESITAEHIVTSEENISTIEVPSSEDNFGTEHIVSSEENVSTLQISSSEETVGSEHIVPLEENVSTIELPSSEGSIGTEHIVTSDENACTVHTQSSEGSIHTEHIVTSDENVSTEDIQSLHDSVGHEVTLEETVHPELIVAEENDCTVNITTPEEQKTLEKSKEDITFEERFVQPLFKNSETLQKTENQEEKSPVEDCQYRSVLKIEENTVLLEICGELVEISVNQINGKKVITVVPISNSTTVDINDNYEHTDRTQTNDQVCGSNLVENDTEMPELHEEISMELNEDSKDKKLPVLDKMISSSEDVENVIRNEEITSTQMESIESHNEEMFEDIILNENEIIIGDESLEEEINLDLKSDECPSQEKPILCTKAAKKSYETVSGIQQPKPHSSLREFRKIKNKPEQTIEKISVLDQSSISKEKKHLKNTTRTSTRQKNVSEQKEESQVALQELVKQRKMRKEKIRLKYPYVVDKTEVIGENLPSIDTGLEKIRQDKEVKSEIRKVPNVALDNVKSEKHQVSSVVHKVKSTETKRRESSEIHGIKAKCRDKIRRKSSEEKIHIVASVIVKEPYSNRDADKTKTEEKPSSTSQISINPSTTGKEVSNQNFPEARTSTNMEVAKNTNVQEKHSKFPKTSTPRDLSLTKNINEHYLSRKDHSNLKKKLSIQEYNSRKRKMEEVKIVTSPEKKLRLEEFTKTNSLVKDKSDKPSTIYSGRQFENVSNCVKDPRRLQFHNSKEEKSVFFEASNISRTSGGNSSSTAIIVNPLLNISADNKMKTSTSSSLENSSVEISKSKNINLGRRKSTEVSEKKYQSLETHKRKVSFDDNVQINEIHTTQTKVSKSRQDSSSSYCEVTSSCSDSFEERGSGDVKNILCEDKTEDTKLEYQNNLVRKVQNEDRMENNWEDSNSPKDCITDAFSDCFLEKSRLESVKNATKSKLIIDINDFDTSLINNELKGSYKTNPSSGEETLKNYKEEVDIKLNSLNIQIPKTTKNRVINEDDLLMHKFLRKEQLNSDEIKQIRRIIYFKKKIQQLTQQNVINNNKTNDNKYEIKKSPESSSNKDLKLQLKKVDGRIRKKKKRFRNLYSNSPETSENEIPQTAGEFSVYEGENISGVKLIFKRKTDLLNLQPVVRLQRYKYIDSMAKKLKYE